MINIVFKLRNSQVCIDMKWNVTIQVMPEHARDFCTRSIILLDIYLLMYFIYVFSSWFSVKCCSCIVKFYAPYGKCRNQATDKNFCLGRNMTSEPMQLKLMRYIFTLNTALIYSSTLCCLYIIL
jgi:hypothetical protein